MFKKLKEWLFDVPPPPPIPETHKHEWSKWVTKKDSTLDISQGKMVVQHVRILVQERSCLDCGYKDMDIKKQITGSISFDEIGKKA